MRHAELILVLSPFMSECLFLVEKMSREVLEILIIDDEEFQIGGQIATLQVPSLTFVPAFRP